MLRSDTRSTSSSQNAKLKKESKMSFQVISLPGLTPFQEVFSLQEKLLDQRIRDEIPDTLIFCEHTPVITRGRGLQRVDGREERAKPLALMPAGTEYIETNRGGDLTWHGPGQLVLYPIIKLGGDGELGKKIGQDVNGYIRFLENIYIDLLSKFEITATSKEGGSGVWLGERKVASVGIALRRWVSYHGIAINLVNDLFSFQAFDPCGFDANVMTRLKDHSKIPSTFFENDWRAQWEKLIVQSLTK
jgi:lipoyl(octanoyl) transferase